MKRALVLAAAATVGSLIAIAPAAEAELRVGKNYRLGSDSAPFRGKDQIGLAVNPRNPQHIVAVNADYLTQECEHTVSFDGGSSWTPALPLKVPPGFRPSCRVPDHQADQFYQAFAFGRGNNVYVAYVTAKIAAGGGEEGASVLVAKSTDGGRTFGAPVIAMRGGPSSEQASGPSYELPTLNVDPGATASQVPEPTAPASLRDCPSGRQLLNFSPGNDRRNGTAGNDLIFAGGGDDIVDALAGDDCIDLGPGQDRGQGNSGHDLVVGGLGNDVGTGSSGNDRVHGDEGNDRLSGNSGNDRMRGGTGRDRMFGGFGNDRIHGGSGRDSISGSRARDRINGGSSGDRISGGNHSDRIAGDAGNDRINGNAGNDAIRGNSGRDRIKGSSGRDRISGGSGNDFINARDGRRDRVTCDGGRDVVAADRIDRVSRTCDVVRRSGSRSVRAASASSSGAEPRATTATEVPERVYVVATETTESVSAANDIATTVSSDGGRTFSPVKAADPAGENSLEASQPVIGEDGSIYIAYRNLSANKPAGDPVPPEPRPLKVVRSLDHGRTWQLPVTVAMVTPGGTTNTSHVTPDFSTASTFPRLAVDKRNGTVYIVYNQGPPGPTAGPFGFQGADHFIHLDADVYFQRSTSHGTRWSVPKRINDATPRPGSVVTQTRHPNVYVAPNGRVDIVWQDRRHWYQPPDPVRRCIHTHLACQEARLGDTYYAYSNDAGSSFSANRRITDRSHNNDVGYDYRFGVGWAFGPVAAHLGDSQLLVGWMDSREGNFQNDNLDIYLAKVNHAASGAVPQETVQEPNLPALSVRLSRLAYPGGGEGLMAGNFATRNGTRVVIANEADYPGTLAGGVLARANLSQTLLSPVAALPPNVRAEIQRMDPAGAYVIGDATKLSPTIEAELASLGISPAQIERIQGATPAALAANIAIELDRRDPAEKNPADPRFAPAFDAVVIANPNSPDAAAAAGLAAARRLPFLYVDQNAIPPATSAALAALNINRTLVVGGTDDVSNQVLAQLPGPTRLGGANQYETSAAVVEESKQRGLPDNIAFATNGDTPIDGALVGSTVGRINGLQFLAPPPLSSNAISRAGALDLTSRLDRLFVVE